VSDDRSLIAWQHWRQSAEKVDYFVLGIASALTAYLGQHLSFSKLGANPATAELLSLVLLGGSVVAGLDRLRSSVSALNSDGHALQAQERVEAMKDLLAKGKGTTTDRETGRTFTLADAEAEVQRAEQLRDFFRKQNQKWTRRCERAYNWRDRLLVVGVVVYVAAKVWAAALA
jgi:hypothetical protein